MWLSRRRVPYNPTDPLNENPLFDASPFTVRFKHSNWSLAALQYWLIFYLCESGVSYGSMIAFNIISHGVTPDFHRKIPTKRKKKA
ncbi:hypothetical protein NPIL_304831 [Nephila pilipes]|uniref:Uncharacterized protein n=1 Tax=Nephila pilipes TaxID=299642 RepID=A0A8X6PVX8_NEPPI|nr:hypothetical protein NPIL_304831 [Nephila pilipes]